MQFVVDTHVHIYPFYEVERALAAILKNLSAAGPDSIKVACLTERYDCSLYADLSTNPAASVTAIFDIIPNADSLLIRDRNGAGEFHLLPGQQIITAENIEVLSLNCKTLVAEAQSAAATVDNILALGGIPVVAWAPGKWFFKRGEVVAQLLEKFSPAQLALGDTTLRPLGWGTPGLIRKAKERGFRILYGSDPLPFKGEEVRPGSYLTKISVADRNNQSDLVPSQIIANLLTDKSQITAAGKRGSLLTVLTRLYNNHRAPKPARAAAVTE